ncbi:TLP18.3/Psb32/MOLO-1 phosphatase superfamily protein [Chitinophaga skermanii]|uniref:TLP18.3/Psb32/MOLO-1 phosphatase superfamily protein n=1 Tax=Chitinophaga skermanii TaxID=331697 RepID=A0A327QIY6_9BACT|nr:TPM domain-containing protein [Chitinophaga skermanii]RAJ04310.1 TLP18.3/Psb32/MOLO-1 phosphatase superfamily protein [Chitinophaga skermanii]
MGLFSLGKKKPLFNDQEQAHIVQAIRIAERLTSGEIRVYVESRCTYVDPIDRAKEVFAGLGMNQTKHRNGVLLYLALADHQFAIFGDEGIHTKVGQDFWHKEAHLLRTHFGAEQIIEGISACVKEIGESLQQHFPYDNEDDKNELPDDIVFGH